MLVFSETFEDIDRSNAIFTFHDSCPRRLVQERTGWLWHDWPEYSKGWAKMTQRVGLTWRMPDQQPYAVVAWKRQNTNLQTKNASPSAQLELANSYALPPQPKPLCSHFKPVSSELFALQFVHR